MEGGKRLSGFSLNQQLPSVAIITVVYNSVNFLERTILSVKSQSFSNIEHIILDGGSTDGTLELIRQYSEEIAYWKSEKDHGIYDAMNKAQTFAKADYILFLNAGDEFVNDKVLDHCFQLLADADVYYGDTIITDIEGFPVGTRRLRPPKQLRWTDFRYGMLVCHQSILIKRALSVPYNIQYRIAADIDWAIRSIRAAKTIVNAGIPMTKFMEGGASSVHQRKGLKERFIILTRHYGLLPNLLVHAYMVFRLIFQKITR
jgi:glycosyltransferase involved in cell wall biosynthesis